jgi:hypothetical protein
MVFYSTVVRSLGHFKLILILRVELRVKPRVDRQVEAIKPAVAKYLVPKAGFDLRLIQ